MYCFRLNDRWGTLGLVDDFDCEGLLGGLVVADVYGSVGAASKGLVEVNYVFVHFLPLFISCHL